MGKMQLNYETILAETILAPVMTALFSEQYTPAPDEPVAKGEKILGELTPFEKALFTVKDQIADKCNGLIEGRLRRGDESIALITEIKTDKRNFEAIDTLFWASIRNRLGDKSHETGGIGIREEYQVVQMPSRDDIFSDLLSSLKGAIEGADVHDCEACSSYDECELPFKKVRVA